MHTTTAKQAKRNTHGTTRKTQEKQKIMVTDAAAPAVQLPPRQRQTDIWQQAVGRLCAQHTTLLKRVRQLEHLVVTCITSNL